MVIRYIDPEGGNDANDGLTFATRKRGLNSATFTVTPGDDIRVIASPDPASIGTCQWTDGSGTITVPPGLFTQIDDFKTAWTVSANVTTGANSNRKQGGNSYSVSIASAFVTGKVAYRTLAAPLNLTGFSALSFWHIAAGAIPVNSLELRLCSDAVGDVSVASIPLTDARYGNAASGWRVVCGDVGALPSGVNSVALWAVTDPGLVTTLSLDNLIACKAEADPQHLSHLTIIGKKTEAEPEWYSLHTLASDAVILGAYNSSAMHATPPRPYKGVTEAVNTFALRPLKAWTAAERSAGTVSVADVLLSGGWNRENMSAQTGITWFTGLHFMASITNANVYGWTVRKFAGAHFTSAVIAMQAANDIEIEAVCGSVQPVSLTNGGDGRPGRFRCKQVWGCGGTNITGLLLPVDFWFGRVHGYPSTGGAVVLAGKEKARVTTRVDKIDNSAAYGVLQSSADMVFSLVGTVFENNALGDVRLTTTAASTATAAYLTDCLFDLGVSLTGADANAGLFITNYNRDPTDQRIIRWGWNVMSDTAVRHTASGYSWRLSQTLLAAAWAAHPARFRLGLVALRAGIPATISAWVRRNNLGIAAGIRIPAEYAPGRVELSAAAAGPVDTWEQVTLAFTPERTTVVPVDAWGYGGTTYSAWFDDMGASQ